ncbi:hypothetical protein [Streptomyces sp. NPDC059278]|uniref:hypothetical protein n=1 Tax=Streptomyces sp. NPDC059278 TaxID=3346801 RepID=UPI0036CD0AF1
MTTNPAPEPEELEDTERTVEELAEILSTGGKIEAFPFPSDAVLFHVTLAEVVVFARFSLDTRAISELATGLPEEIRLYLPPTDSITNGLTETGTDVAEQALLARALEARSRLIGG